MNVCHPRRFKMRGLSLQGSGDKARILLASMLAILLVLASDWKQTP